MGAVLTIFGFCIVATVGLVYLMDRQAFETYQTFITGLIATAAALIAAAVGVQSIRRQIDNQLEIEHRRQSAEWEGMLLILPSVLAEVMVYCKGCRRMRADLLHYEKVSNIPTDQQPNIPSDISNETFLTLKKFGSVADPATRAYIRLILKHVQINTANHQNRICQGRASGTIQLLRRRCF